MISILGRATDPQGDEHEGLKALSGFSEVSPELCMAGRLLRVLTFLLPSDEACDPLAQPSPPTNSCWKVLAPSPRLAAIVEPG